MEKIATKTEIVEDWTLEDVVTANEMLNYMSISSGDAGGPAQTDPEVAALVRGLSR